MSNVNRIEREEVMDWAIRMMDGGVWNNDTMVVGVGIRHVFDEDGIKTYIVVSDGMKEEIWYPLGKGIVGGITRKPYKGGKSDE